MFSDLIYYLLLGITAVIYGVLPRGVRTPVLVIAGLAFYGYYAGPWFFLLLGLTVATWIVMFGKGGKAWTGAASLIVIVASVLALGIFKYTKFFGGLAGMDFAHFPAAPLALSFFTFEFVHVAVERKKGTIETIPFMDYMSFIFFFPTMIAGPIKRWEHFAKGLVADRAGARDVLEGIFRIALGLTKKLVIADNLNVIIGEIGAPKAGGKPIIYLFAVFLYGLRIWLDFAGYSDIAIGSARLFGIKVPENFLSPYTQTNIASYWRNWHVSLTNWFTDYVFIPLGGSRGTLAQGCLNVILVMGLSGLWHGAAWNFVCWGLWHGVLLAGLRVYRTKLLPGMPSALTQGTFATVASYLITMVCVWFGWMIFMWPLSSVGDFFKLAMGGLR